MMVVMNDEVLVKRRCYGEPSTRAPTLKSSHFVKMKIRGSWVRGQRETHVY